MSEYQPSENLCIQNQMGQLHKGESVPDLCILRHRFLDERRHDTPGALLDCVAHMLLYIDQSDRLLEIALSYLELFLLQARMLTIEYPRYPGRAALL